MRYVVTGGGTGGHIYPAIAVAKQILSLGGAEVLYVGSRTGLESQLVPREDIPFVWIDAAGVVGKGVKGATQGALTASRGFFQSLHIMRRFKPDVVVGTGGYVSGPVVLACKTLGAKVALMEQNAVPGLTNRMLSRFSAEVYVPFEGACKHFPTRARCVFTGNPVRREIVNATRTKGAAELGLKPDKRTLFVFGGSRGAKAVVGVALEMIEKKMLSSDVQVLLVTGRDYDVMVRERLAQIGYEPEPFSGLVVRPYLYTVEHGYAASDLLLGRAGGMTVSEALACGLPSVLIPSPNVTNNHQYYNAKAAEDTGGSVCIPEASLDATELAKTINDILHDSEKHAQMACNARKAGRPDATMDIAQRLVELAGTGGR